MYLWTRCVSGYITRVYFKRRIRSRNCLHKVATIGGLGSELLYRRQLVYAIVMERLFDITEPSVRYKVPFLVDLLLFYSVEAMAPCNYILQIMLNNNILLNNLLLKQRVK